MVDKNLILNRTFLLSLWIFCESHLLSLGFFSSLSNWNVGCAFSSRQNTNDSS